MLIGIDIVDIERIRDTAVRTPRFLDRVFTKQELNYCFSKSNPYPSLAARWAAREAFRKLDSAFSSGILFQEVEVFCREDGRPELLIHGTAMERCREQGIYCLAISLSHSKSQAVAAVIATKG